MTTHRIPSIAVAIAAAVTLTTSACSQIVTGADGSDSPALAAIDAAAVQPAGIIGAGPNGETAADPSTVELTPEQADRIRAGNFSVGIAMQTMDIDFASVQTAVMQEEFEKYGVQVVGITDAQWKTEKQIGDLENLIQQKPDGILGVPVDDVATSAAFQSVGRAGIKLVMIDQVPQGLQYPLDYQSSVQADGRGNGEVSAEMLASIIPQDGVLGMINFGNDIFATNERTIGAREWLAVNRPDITVKETAFNEPAKAGQIGSDFVTANPDIDGLWVVWDAPALEVLSALRAQGTNLPMATLDLGRQLSAEIAQGANVVGVGAQRLSEQAVAEAHVMMLALLGEPTPAYIAAPALAVSRSNLLPAYETVFGAPAPDDLGNACAELDGCA